MRKFADQSVSFHRLSVLRFDEKGALRDVFGFERTHYRRPIQAFAGRGVKVGRAKSLIEIRDSVSNRVTLFGSENASKRETMSRGFLYAATGDRFRAEARASASRVKELMPGVALAIASDREPKGDLFDHWIPIENPTGSFADKIAPLAQTPFQETVFLDTDTYLCKPVPELFELLGRCDIAMAHAPMRYTGEVPVPAAFSEFNTGVIAYRASEKNFELFSRWLEVHAAQVLRTGDPCDQPALRRALWESDAKCVVLPPEYNFRFVLPSFAGRGPVKILHGRHHDMAALACSINQSGSPRVFLPQLRDAGPRSFRILSAPGRAAGFWFGLDAVCANWVGKAWDGIRARCRRPDSPDGT